MQCFCLWPKGSKWQRINPSNSICTQDNDNFQTGSNIYPSCESFNERAVNYAKANCKDSKNKSCIKKQINSYLKNTDTTICLEKA